MKIVFCLLLIAFSFCVNAQYRTERYDTTYYMSYRNKLTLGALVLKKNNVFKTDAASAESSLRFRPNSSGHFGFSASHDFIALSATIGIGKLDPFYSSKKEKTKQTNFQLNVTGRRILADIYFQKYKGLYADIPNMQTTEGKNNEFYSRPDIETNLYGTTVTILENPRKFSAQAALLLDAWQKKSAGSILYSGEIFYGAAKGDSAFVPQQLSQQFSNSEISKIKFIAFGPGIGYGYSLIIKKHFFVTGMVLLNADVSYIKQWKQSDAHHAFWKFNPNLKAKGAMGYNTEGWGIGVSYFSNRLFFKGLEDDTRYLNYNDDFKLLFTRRINAGKTIPKVVRAAGKVIQKVGLGFLID